MSRPLLLMLSLCLVCEGQGAVADLPGLPFVQVFTPRDYSEHAQNWDVTQDTDGLLYVANNNGTVLTYDGHEWTSVKVGGFAVRGLAWDTAGRLWYGSIGDLGYLEKDGRGGFIHTSLRDRVPAEAQADLVMYHVAAQPDGIFFFTRDYVLRWDGQTIQAEKIRRLWAVPAGDRLLRHTADRPLEEWRDGAWRTLADTPELRRWPVRFAAPQSDGSLLLGTNLGGFFVLKDGTLTPWPTGCDAFLKTAGIERGRRLRDGSLVLSHRPRGFSILKADGRLRHHFSDKNSPLPTPIAWGFFEDRQDNLWVPLDNGLARIDGPNGITYYGQSGGARRLNATVVSPFRDQIYLGTSAGLLRLESIAPDANTPSTAQLTPVPGFERDIRSLFPSRDELLLGGPSGLYAWRGADTLPLPLLPNTYVFLVWVSPQDPDQVLIGTTEGLRLMRREAGAWHIGDKLPGIDTEIRGFGVDADGAIWLATLNRGFYRLLGVPGTASADGQPIRIERYPGGHGLRTEQFTTPTRLATVDGRTRFLDDGRSFHFDPASRRFVEDFAIGEHLGVPGAEVVQFRDDVAGNFWPFMRRKDAAGWPARGLQIFRAYANGEARTVPHRVADYIGTNPMLQQFRDASGRDFVLLAGSEGMVRLDLPRALEPMPPIHARITAITDETGAALSLGAVAPLEFSRRTLTLRAATDRFGDAHLRYQFRTDDGPWSGWSELPRHTFERLSAGQHALQVRARDAQGAVSEAVSVAASILPPWWQTWWAWTLYGMGAASVVAGMVRWRGRALRRRNEELEHLVAARTTELAEAKTTAESASAAKSTFLAGMSHELRTPLNAILGFAQILRRDEHLNDEQRQRLTIINRNGDHLLQMINEILDLSKIEAGRLALAPCPVDLARLLATVADTFAQRATDKGLAFHREFAAQLPAAVLVDELKLRQVLINLLGNAVKFTETGSVTFRVEPAPGGALRFAVADTGIGIEDGERERIFEPFHQTAGRLAQLGTGLGLAISQRIVGLMGGTIRVESRPGHGSRFWFEIASPAAEPVNAPPAGTVTGYAGQRRRLLVVDDKPANRDVLRALLEPLGFVIEECSDGRACLAAFQRQPADAIFLDLRMPGELDGYAAARALRALSGGSEPAIIAVSASVFEEDRQTALDAGCDAFVPKPFSEERLFSALGDCLDLQWILREPVTPGAATAEVLPAAVVEELRDLARRGDIKAFRERIRFLEAAHPDSAATLAHLDSLAAGFQLGRLRQELRTAHSTASRPPA